MVGVSRERPAASPVDSRNSCNPGKTYSRPTVGHRSSFERLRILTSPDDPRRQGAGENIFGVSNRPCTEYVHHLETALAAVRRLQGPAPGEGRNRSEGVPAPWPKRKRTDPPRPPRWVGRCRKVTDFPDDLSTGTNKRAKVRVYGGRVQSREGTAVRGTGTAYIPVAFEHCQCSSMWCQEAGGS